MIVHSDMIIICYKFIFHNSKLLDQKLAIINFYIKEKLRFFINHFLVAFQILQVYFEQWQKNKHLLLVYGFGIKFGTRQ